MADDGITNLSEIDWDNVTMQPHHALEGYEPRPEYSEIVQERKRNKVVLGLRIFRVAVKLFAVLGACLLMKVIIDYAEDIKNGVIEPPAYTELAFLVYLLIGMVLMLGLLMMARRLRQSKYGNGHPINTAPVRHDSHTQQSTQSGAVKRHVPA